MLTFFIIREVLIKSSNKVKCQLYTKWIIKYFSTKFSIMYFYYFLLKYFYYFLYQRVKLMNKDKLGISKSKYETLS